MRSTTVGALPLRTLAATLALAALGSCRVGPDYAAPELPAPAAWSTGADAIDSSAVERRWWTLFRDPVLDSLVARALSANHDLRMATARLREVRARYRVEEAVLLPAVDALGSVERQEVDGDGRAAQLSSLLGQNGRTTYEVGFDTTWELDLFGGNRRAVEAAAADVQGAEAERGAALVSLLGEVGRTYVSLRGAQRQAEVFRRSATSARETLDLTRALRDAGLATDLDVARADALRAELEAELPSLDAAARRAIHRLGFLLGEPPGALVAELSAPAPIPTAPPRVLAGLPSDLVARRPDLRREERALASATARVGVATADLYPRFSLSAALGLQAFELDELLGADTRRASARSGVRWPVFDAGRIRARIAAQDAVVEAALAAYERSYLAALAEVEDAFVDYVRELERRRSLEESVAASRKAARLARELFEGDLATFLDSLDAERVSYEAEARLAQSETAVATNLVRIYKALGGGWEAPVPSDAP